MNRMSRILVQVPLLVVVLAFIVYRFVLGYQVHIYPFVMAAFFALCISVTVYLAMRRRGNT